MNLFIDSYRLLIFVSFEKLICFDKTIFIIS